MKLMYYSFMEDQQGAGIVEVLIAAILFSLFMIGAAQLLVTGEEDEANLRMKQLADQKIQEEFDQLAHQIKKGTFDITIWGNGCSCNNSCSLCKKKTFSYDLDQDGSKESVYIQVEEDPDLKIPPNDSTQTYGFMVRCYIKGNDGVLLSQMITFVAKPN